MKMSRLLALAALGFIASAAQAQTGLAQSKCGPTAGQKFVCGPKNAEDLVLVPGTQWLIASSMTPGAGLVLVNARDGRHSALYPAARAQVARAARYPDCSTPPAPTTFEMHGLSLRAGKNGHSTLYAVAHGEREAIEVFNVDATSPRPTLTWQGCVLMPTGLAANSVASLADGSILATVLFTPGKTFADAVVHRKPTGAVYEWAPGKKGFELVRGSELPANNGIEVSADGREFYVASSGLQTIVAFAHSNPTRQLRSSRPLPFTPDNVHMGADGHLLTAGMANDVPECGGPPGAGHDLTKLAICPRGTIAVSIDPKTMAHKVIVTTQATPVFSNATMVLVLNGEAWIGTFSGSRIARSPLR
jgi:SMP-30/Gluconolactonase/LRE-like region